MVQDSTRGPTIIAHHATHEHAGSDVVALSKADMSDFSHGASAHTGSVVPAADQDFSEHQALAFRVENLATLPTAGNKGRLVLQTSDNKIYYDNGSAWVAW